MKKLLLTTVGTLTIALLSAATAADLSRRPAAMPAKAPAAYVAPIYNWTGLYLGINGGGGWGNSSWTDLAGTTGDFDVSGALIGGTLGYNWQAGQLVFGIEGDVAWSNIEGSTSVGICATGCTTENNWLGTARVRLGYAFDRVLPYVTGGAAFGDIDVSRPGFAGESDTQVGWTVGGGVEFALPANWTAKGEYLYVDLGDIDCSAANCGGTGTTTVDFKTHVLRAGLNYRF